VNPDIPRDGFFLLTEYTWGMTSHIHPLCRSRKLAALIVSLFPTASPSLLGCSIADRVTPIDGAYRIVERVIDGDRLAGKRRTNPPDRRRYSRNKTSEKTY
jgi:hypothetical protein